MKTPDKVNLSNYIENKQNAKKRTETTQGNYQKKSLQIEKAPKECR
jgi:hypothetical protein